MGTDLVSGIVSIVGTLLGLIAFFIYQNYQEKEKERKRLEKEVQLRDEFIKEQKRIIEDMNKKKEAHNEKEDEFFKE